MINVVQRFIAKGMKYPMPASVLIRLKPAHFIGYKSSSRSFEIKSKSNYPKQ